MTDPVAESADWEGADDESDEIEWVDEPGGAAPPPATPTVHKPWPDPGEFAAEEIEQERQRARTEQPQPTSPVKVESPRPARAEPRPKRPMQAGETPVSPASKPVQTDAAYAAGLSLGEWLRSHRNGLVFVTVVVVVVATVAFRIRRARLAELPIVAEKGWTEGLTALDSGKFDTARQLLSEARDAVDTLGDDSEHAADIRQGAKEIAILTSLCPDTLETLLDQAARSDSREWSDQFNRLYKGRSIVVDAQVKGRNEASKGDSLDLDYRVFRPGEGDRPRSVARLDLKGFTLLDVLKPRVGDHVLFGARLASFKLDPDTDEWLIGLEPGSGVTMVHHRALEATGWPVPEDATEDERR